MPRPDDRKTALAGAEGRWPRLAAALVIALAPAFAPAPVASADVLGDARLFFTSEERGIAADTKSGRDPNARGAHGSLPDGRVNGDAADGSAADGVDSDPDSVDVVARIASPSHGTSARGAAGRPIGFEALIRIGDRIRVVVDGRPCRGSTGETELRCDRLPDGVRALALASDGRGLVVTLRDGRRRRLAVGDRLEP